MKHKKGKYALFGCATLLLCAFAFGTKGETGVSEQPLSIDGFCMKDGASLRLLDGTGLRFSASVPETAVGEYAFSFVIAPTAYFAVAKDDFGATPDYVSAFEEFEKEGATPAIVLACAPYEQDGAWEVQASLVDILDENTNLSFSAVAFAEDDDGNRVYASFSKSVEESGRSMSYLSTAALCDENGGYTDEQIESLRAYSARSLQTLFSRPQTDEVLGVELVFSASPKSQMAVGESQTLSAYATVEFSGASGTEMLAGEVPIFWESSDPTVLTVSKKGELLAVGEGQATVSAHFGETSVSAEIVCIAPKTYACSVQNVSREKILDLTYEENVLEGTDLSLTVEVISVDYGDVSFFIGGTPYSTTNGKAEIKLSVKGDTVFEIKCVSTAWAYFDINAGSALLKGTLKTLPKKVILPAYDGNTKRKLTNIADGLFASSAVEEVSITENYASFVATRTVFQNCANLKTVYVYSSTLGSAASSSNNLWSGCAVENIYVPTEKVPSYQNSTFWLKANATISGIAVSSDLLG